MSRGPKKPPKPAAETGAALLTCNELVTLIGEYMSTLRASKADICAASYLIAEQCRVQYGMMIEEHINRVREKAKT